MYYVCPIFFSFIHDLSLTLILMFTLTWSIKTSIVGKEKDAKVEFTVLYTLGQKPQAYPKPFLSFSSEIKLLLLCFPSVQFSSVAQSCPTLYDPMNHSTPDLPVHHQLPEFTQTHVHWVSDAIQPSHPLLSPSPPAHNPSQHQSLFQWVNSLHEVAKVLEFQL